MLHQSIRMLSVCKMFSHNRCRNTRSLHFLCFHRFLKHFPTLWVSFCIPWCHCTPWAGIKCTAKMQVLWIFQHLPYCMQLGSHFMQWSLYWFGAIGVLHLPHQASHGPCISKEVRNLIAHSVSSSFINQATWERHKTHVFVEPPFWFIH
jgi:hypothetical protein